MQLLEVTESAVLGGVAEVVSSNPTVGVIKIFFSIYRHSCFIIHTHTHTHTRLGVKRVTEPNRTEPPDYTGQSQRKFPIVAVPGFTAVTRTEPANAIFCAYLA